MSYPNCPYIVRSLLGKRIVLFLPTFSVRFWYLLLYFLLFRQILFFTIVVYYFSTCFFMDIIMLKRIPTLCFLCRRQSTRNGVRCVRPYTYIAPGKLNHSVNKLKALLCTYVIYGFRPSARTLGHEREGGQILCDHWKEEFTKYFFLVWGFPLCP